MSIIPELTKECARDDCRISGGNSGVSTCVGWSPTYDKHGNRTDRGDPNSFTTSYACASCGARWVVGYQYGKAEIFKG